jgi:Protein of unknown function (DUF4232)
VTPSPGTPSMAPAVIPWVAAPAPRVIVPDVNAVVVHHAAYRPCTASDLEGGTTGGGAGLGVGSQQLTFTNVSATPCTLSGGPLALVGVTRAGGHVVVVGPGAGAGLHLDEVANLLPGAVGYADVIGPRYDKCITDPAYASLEVKLADHTRVAIATPKPWERLTVGCRYDLTAFGTPHHYLPEPTYPTDPLVATTTMPEQVRAGTTIDYTVTLTNPTDKSVPLTPCPTYEEAVNVIGDHGVVNGHDLIYRLNCAGHTSVAPGEALTFAMRIPAPTRPGYAKWGWDLQPGYVGRGGALTVASR